MSRWGRVLGAAVVVAVMAPATANGAISFEAGDPSEFFSGEGSASVEVLDTDRDGIRDLVVGGQALNQLSGLGLGGFDPPVLVNGDVQPGRVLATARLDRDRNRDLALIDYQFDPAKVGVLASRGDGTFRAPRHSGAGPSPYDLAVGDFDGDGRRDLATSSFTSNRLRVLFGRGDGRFTGAQGVDVGNTTTEIAAGDVNGDGRDDLAVVNYPGDSALSVALGRGDRGFRTPADLEVGEDTYAIDIADLDGDKRRDIAVTHSDANASPDSVSVLWRKRRGFTAAAPFALANVNPQSLTLADLNGDGLREVVAGGTSADNVSVFENTNNRTFAAPATFAVGDEPQDIEAAKLDDDGLLDLVTANNNGDNVSVLINGL